MFSLSVVVETHRHIYEKKMLKKDLVETQYALLLLSRTHLFYQIMMSGMF